jgi:hypothetical protein
MANKHQRNPWRKGQMKRWLRDHAVIPGRANYRPCERRAKKND